MPNEDKAPDAVASVVPVAPPPRSLLSLFAVCDTCRACWPVAHIDVRTDNLVPHEYGPLVHLWLEQHLFCRSVRFAPVDGLRGAAYAPMDASGEPSRLLETLQELYQQRGRERGLLPGGAATLH